MNILSLLALSISNHTIDKFGNITPRKVKISKTKFSRKELAKLATLDEKTKKEYIRELKAKYN